MVSKILASSFHLRSPLIEEPLYLKTKQSFPTSDVTLEKQNFSLGITRVCEEELGELDYVLETSFDEASRGLILTPDNLTAHLQSGSAEGEELQLKFDKGLFWNDHVNCKSTYIFS